MSEVTVLVWCIDPDDPAAWISTSTTEPVVVSAVLEGCCPDCGRSLNVCPVSDTIPAAGSGWLCCFGSGLLPDGGTCPAVPRTKHYRVAR